MKLGETGSGFVSRKAAIFSGSGIENTTDSVTVEEPLEVSVQDKSGRLFRAGVIMRTPSADDYLSVGFLHSEGYIKPGTEIYAVEGVDSGGISRENSVRLIVSHVEESASIPYGSRLVNSSCGICGKASLDEIYLRVGRLQRSRITVKAETVLSLPDIMRKEQRIFSSTGGLHAAGLFTADGSPLFVGEDIGRHNAVDKVIGWSVMNSTDLHDKILQVSGRAGFEIVQKAAVSGIPVVCSVSAPSSLAVDLCDALGITLICFVREKRFNIYTNGERVSLS